ncbi:MAG: putative protein-disulfide isomerase [Halioglobus sp.]|jgi:putative protein-disulfide isomerase
MPATLYHVHDPMCSWCWGFRRSWDALRTSLPEAVTVVNVVGGLAPDSDEPMPHEQREAIASYWAKIGEEVGAEFNLDFWSQCEPRRSTYPACRAVIAASFQSQEQGMIDAIQHAYYLRAMNPSDISTLLQLAEELGLDRGQFSDDLGSEHTEQEMQRHFALRRHLNVYSFPSLVLETDSGLHPVLHDYHSATSSLEIIKALIQP